MSEYQRSFSLTTKVAISGVTLASRTGPTVEAWNRRHDRNAGLCVTQSYCEGVPLNRDNAYCFGTEWKQDFLMTGPLASDEKVAEFSSLMLEAICAQEVELPVKPPAPIE